MSVPEQQQATARLLHALSGAKPIETHISLVYVGHDTAWKLRKAVRLSFLDFSSLEARRRFSFREIELNSDAAPGLYRDVVPVLRRPDRSVALGDAAAIAGEVVDWVVRMAPVPPDRFLERIALSKGLDPDLLDAIADSVAEYHQKLPPAAPQAAAEAADAMRLIALGNANSALEAGLPARPVQAWLELALKRLDGLADWLDARARGGSVRRAHGDLHLGNMCLWRGRPVPFDALEFDDAMATIDLGYDLAFLLMDVDHRIGRAQANRVLNRYVARTGDAALTQGLPLFLSLRSMIRAHVEHARARTALARTYVRAAERYLRPAPPCVVAIGGLPGCGKSTLARALAGELGAAPGALVLRSDEIRKRQHRVAPEQRLPAEAYTDAIDRAVMRALLAEVEGVAAAGHAVIADATFVDHEHRRGVERAARRAGAPFVGLWLQAPSAMLEERLRARVHDASDADVEVLRRLRARGRSAEEWVAVDACRADAALAQARKALRAGIAA
jgi:aminoglycoside phosphotransferase family enzyme/predicted kinase